MNKEENMNNNEYNNFKKVPVKQPVQQPVQPIQNNANCSQMTFENFNNNNQVNYLYNKNKNDVYNRDPTEQIYDNLKFDRNHDLEVFKEIQGGYYVYHKPQNTSHKNL